MGKNLANSHTTFLFCDGGPCRRAGSEQVVREGRAYLRNADLWESTHTIKTHCNGRCEDAPTCIVQPGNHWYKKLDADKIVEIIKSHVEEQRPVEPYLLFTEGWEGVHSDDELAEPKPKAFELVQDAELGECYLTKGFSTDQYLYPLFKYIAEHRPLGRLSISGQSPVRLHEITSIRYQDPYALELTFGDGTERQLMIGNIPRTEAPELVDQKIVITEYFLQTGTGMRGIRFKNRKTRVLGKIIFGNNELMWGYCLRVMLGGLPSPQYLPVT